MVCEADELARKTISEVARSLKFVVIEAVTGPQALSALLVADAEFGFLDLSFPDLGGLYVARRVRSVNLRHAPTLVAVSGVLSPDDQAMYREVGFEFHLPRPINPERVVEILTSLN